MKLNPKRIRDASFNVGVALVIAAVVQVLYSKTSLLAAAGGAIGGIALILAAALEEKDQ